MRIPILLCVLLSTLSGQVQRVDPPSLDQSGMPFLTDGQAGPVWLSWTDPLGDKTHALRYSRWTGTQWSPPETVATGKNWFVNWGDFPSLTIQADGSMLAHWLTRAEGGGTYGYGIRVAKKAADASEWRQIFRVSLDEKEDYAGFLTFVPGGKAAIYLSPPSPPGKAAPHGHEEGHRKTVRFVSFRDNGAVETDRELDSDACSCCQTAIGRTRSGLIAAYRDHLPGEIRDISVMRFENGTWTPPKLLHPDGWRINGCPTDGPAISADSSDVAITWLTRANDIPRIQVALSSDEGRTFRAPLRVDGGNPLGRPAIASFDKSNYVIVWLEKTSNSDAEIRLRRVTHDGRLLPSFTVAAAAAGRSTGFPKVAVTGEQILLAWRDQRVRAALLTKQQLKEREQK